jgi:hypothetical protein
MLCHGQTNITGAAKVQFSLPSVQLRSETRTQSEKSASDIQRPAAISVQNVALETSLSNFEPRSSVVRSDEFYLVRTQVGFDSPVERFVDSVFRPEVYHLGKTEVSCSFLTAIKRKNPLCLLNPLVVQVSW